MSYNSGFRMEDETQLLKDIDDAAKRMAQYTSFASPQVADYLGQLGELSVDGDPGAALAIANAAAAGDIGWDQARNAYMSSAELVTTDTDRYVDQGGQKSWFKNLASKPFNAVKLASRWTMAGLNFLPQTVSNGLARLYGSPILEGQRGIEAAGYYQRPETGWLNGWFASTDLGAMFSGEDAGEGYFVGEAAKQYQEQKVLEYRGGFLDENGQAFAFTPGRMVGGIFWQPGQGQYNLLSGLVDASAAFIVPAVPLRTAGAASAAARAGQYGSAAQKVASQLPEVGQISQLRRYAGLTDGMTPHIRKEKVGQFLDSRVGKALINRIAATDTISGMVDLFPRAIDKQIFNDLLNADNVDDVKNLLVRYLQDVPGGDVNVGINSVNQLPKLGLREVWRPSSIPNNNMFRSVLPQGARDEVRRLRARAVKSGARVLTFNDSYETVETLHVMTAVLDTLRVDDFLHNGQMVNRETLLRKALDIGMDPAGGGLKEFRDMVDSAMVEGLTDSLARRWRNRWGDVNRDQLNDSARALLKQHRDSEDSLYGALSSLQDGLFNGFIHSPEEAVLRFTEDERISDWEIGRGVSGEIKFRRPNRTTPYKAVVAGEDGAMTFVDVQGGGAATAMYVAEMMKRSIILPDMDKLRRATSRTSFLFEKSVIAQTSIGDANGLVSFLDYWQHRTFRPFSMMTGGYITRNMADSMFRMAIAPDIRVGPRHPFEWMKLILNRNNRGDLLGFGWDVEEAAARLTYFDHRLRDALRSGTKEINPASQLKDGYRRGAFGMQARPSGPGFENTADFERYVRGVADQLLLGTKEEMAVLIARGVRWDAPSDLDEAIGSADDLRFPNSIREWLETTEAGQKYARATHQKWQNVRAQGTDGTVRYNYPFLDETGRISGDEVEQNWRALIEDMQSRVRRDTLNSNENLMMVMRGDPYEGIPYFKITAPDGTERFVDAYKKVDTSTDLRMDYSGYNEEYLDEIRRIVAQKIESGNVEDLPELVKYSISEAELGDVVGETLGVRDRMITHFFGQVFEKKEIMINRSPVAREFYYQIVDELLDNMRPEDARFVITRVQQAMRQEQRDYARAVRGADTRLRRFEEPEYQSLLGEAQATTARLEAAQQTANQAKQAAQVRVKQINNEVSRLNRVARESSDDTVKRTIETQVRELKAERKRLSDETRRIVDEEPKVADQIRQAKKRQKDIESARKDRAGGYRVEGIKQYRVPDNRQGMFVANGRWVDEAEYQQISMRAKEDALPLSERADARAARREVSAAQKKLNQLRDAEVGVSGKYRVPDGQGGFRLIDDAARQREIAELQTQIRELGVRANAGVLDDDAFRRLLEETGSRRSTLDFDGLTIADAQRYLGSEERWRRLIERANADPDIVKAGALTAEQIDMAAKAYALERTKEVFYDASAKSNFADVMRIIAPFGSAWWEVLSRYTREALQDPNRLKNVGASVRGLRDADVSGDGRGFFYEDPVTKQMMFNFPFDAAFVPFISAFGGYVLGQTVAGRTGGLASRVVSVGGALGASALAASPFYKENIKPEIVAPVRSLSMGFNMLPGFGPVVQMAYQNFAGDKPVLRDFAELVAPYGAEEITPEGFAGTLVPAWAEKTFSALFRNNPDVDQQFGDMFMDTMRALSASGDYNLQDPAEVSRLEQDARKYARSLLLYSAIGQFTGPVRPSIVFDVPVKFDGQLVSEDIRNLVENGNVYSNFLSAAFRQMQDEDFYTAVPRFIRTFGPDVLLYVAASTESNAKGLGVSEQFGRFEQDNAAFASNHPDVFGYFAPHGTDFHYQTYLRQLNTGQRRRVTNPRELIADAEAVVGKALYRDFRREQGTARSAFARQDAALFKDWLYETYPGYKTAELDINARDTVLYQLGRASRDPLIQATEIGRAANMYFAERDRVIEVAQRRRAEKGLPMANSNQLSGNDNMDLRLGLRLYGERLVGRFPMFDRMWSRELFGEVES